MGDWHGYGIGGLSVGEAKSDMYRILEGVHEALPEDRPRYLMGVGFPEDLVARLAEGLVAADAEIAMAATREGDRLQVHPVFCLMDRSLMESLVRFTAEGQRKIDKWTALHRCTEVLFEDSSAFVNANTIDELRQLGGAR